MQAVKPKPRANLSTFSNSSKSIGGKGKAKTQSEDIIEENTFINNQQQNTEKVKLSNNGSESNVSTNVSKETVIIQPPKLKIQTQKQKARKDPLLDYIELDVIGCGSYGRVVKVQKKVNGLQYAMKVIEKKKVEKVSVT